MVIIIGATSCERTPKHTEVKFNGERVDLDTVSFKEGKSYFYSASFDGMTVKFFLVKSNGKTESYFDACSTCYHYKSGYYYSGGNRDESKSGKQNGKINGSIVCRHCGIGFTVADLKVGIGNCCPIRLEGKTIAGGKYEITKEALRGGLKYF
ncbi:MAG: hypothetical protein HQK89_14065 [Nitrospirae bacterium]|nr:hypothetical protein [Nitrospirota bacterium]